MYQQHLQRRGFTLMELMIVIAVIGILAASLFPALSNYFERARKTEAKSEMKQISQIVLDAQIITERSLGSITGNYCTNCSCLVHHGNMTNVPDASSCYIDWVHAINSIALAGGMQSTGVMVRYYRDPWGIPYLLDENENEWPTACDSIGTTQGNNNLDAHYRYVLWLQRSSGQACTEG